MISFRYFSWSLTVDGLFAFYIIAVLILTIFGRTYDIDIKTMFNPLVKYSALEKTRTERVEVFHDQEGILLGDSPEYPALCIIGIPGADSEREFPEGMEGIASGARIQSVYRIYATDVACGML